MRRFVLFIAVIAVVVAACGGTTATPTSRGESVQGGADTGTADSSAPSSEAPPATDSPSPGTTGAGDTPPTTEGAAAPPSFDGPPAPDFELALVDWNMPEMDGEQLSQLIRSHSTQPSIPVLMVTSETDRARLAGIRHSGVSAIFDKPLTVASLRGALQRLLA